MGKLILWDPKRSRRLSWEVLVAMKPKFKKEAATHEDITFVIADAEKFPESRKLATVDNLPTFAAFANGEFKNQVQTNKYDVLKELINEVASN